MSVILWLAAGLIASAAALISPRRPTRGDGSASSASTDDRGFTLQTLIVTAVLVLLAVAAGVVVTAVTTSSSDDLEESTAEIEGRCDPVEIYDPEVAARNEKGKQVAYTNFVNSDHSNTAPATVIELVEFEGSAIGCVPVCVWAEPLLGLPAADNKNRLLQPGEVVFVRDLSQRRDLTINVGRPLFFASERRIYLLASGSSKEELSYFARSGDGLVVEPIHDAAFARKGEPYRGSGSNASVRGRIARVAVAPNQSECHTYDEAGNVLFHDQ